MKKTILFSLACGLLLLSAHAHDGFEIEGIGVEFGFDADSDVNLNSYEVVVPIETPWEWQISESVELELGIEGSAGILDGEGESGGIFTLGFVLEIDCDNAPITLKIATGPSLITEDEFADFDLGGNFQFTSSVGVALDLSEIWSVEYRFQHISNAGLEDQNPGLNMHAISAIYDF